MSPPLVMVVAIPALVQMMHNSEARRGATRAIDCLGALGTNGLPYLLPAIEDTNYPFRSAALYAVTTVPTNPASTRAIGPVVLRCVADPTSDLRSKGFAATWLRRVRYDPGVTIPVLSALIRNSTATENARASAAWALSGYGIMAAGTLPALTNALMDPSGEVRQASSNAIREITLTTATNGAPR